MEPSDLFTTKYLKKYKFRFNRWDIVILASQFNRIRVKLKMLIGIVKGEKYSLSPFSFNITNTLTKTLLPFYYNFLIIWPWMDGLGKLGRPTNRT